MWVPITIALVLLAVGTWFHQAFHREMKRRLAITLETTLDANVTALQIWFEAQEGFAKAIARSERIRNAIVSLESNTHSSEDVRATVRDNARLGLLREILTPIATGSNYRGFLITDLRGRIIAAAGDAPLGDAMTLERAAILPALIEGRSTVSRPFYLPDDLFADTAAPVLLVAAPVLNDDGEIVATAGLISRVEEGFNRMLTVARPGETGEAYAFDASGLLLSPSRFESELRTAGRLPYDATSVLRVEIRNPNDSQRPLTLMAEQAIAGEDGCDVNGYTDYRGTQAIGAWRWLPDYGMGVALELDRDEAYAPLAMLRRMVWGMLALLAVSSGLIVIGSLLVSRFSHKMDAAIEQARQLGQYTLEEKIGEGGMGEVYRARHAMLRRPTVVKLLRPERTAEKDIVRFEREVQLTSQLTHPNTIAIYDYGRTPEGVFYYAMEHLPGVDLDQLVRQSGPLPPGRVIYILKQVCGSLSEAHAAGMIHRDIKPANILLCERGGRFDVAKVLDFGIVKHVGQPDSDDEPDPVDLTADGKMTGTPKYLSPEGIRTPQDVDQRTDLYALGAVGYLLLTGTAVFDGSNVPEVFAQHLRDAPMPPSERLGRPVPADLERVILHCLEKKPEDRPCSAEGLREELLSCADAASWTGEDARRWWAERKAAPKSGLS
ncbi:serine/threonine protein kinase [bacterium]|nr:serine/threonine protein kinase [bacterium]